MDFGKKQILFEKSIYLPLMILQNIQAAVDMFLESVVENGPWIES